MVLQQSGKPFQDKHAVNASGSRNVVRSAADLQPSVVSAWLSTLAMIELCDLLA